MFASNSEKFRNILNGTFWLPFFGNFYGTLWNVFANISWMFNIFKEANLYSEHFWHSFLTLWFVLEHFWNVFPKHPEIFPNNSEMSNFFWNFLGNHFLTEHSKMFVNNSEIFRNIFRGTFWLPFLGNVYKTLWNVFPTFLECSVTFLKDAKLHSKHFRLSFRTLWFVLKQFRMFWQTFFGNFSG